MLTLAFPHCVTALLYCGDKFNPQENVEAFSTPPLLSHLKFNLSRNLFSNFSLNFSQSFSLLTLPRASVLAQASVSSLGLLRDPPDLLFPFAVASLTLRFLGSHHITVIM